MGGQEKRKFSGVWPKVNKTASFQFQKEAMFTQVALWFFYEVKFVEEFLCVWANKTSEHTSWEKFTALKDCNQKEMIRFDCICL